MTLQPRATDAALHRCTYIVRRYALRFTCYLLYFSLVDLANSTCLPVLPTCLYRAAPTAPHCATSTATLPPASAPPRAHRATFLRYRGGLRFPAHRLTHATGLPLAGPIPPHGPHHTCTHTTRAPPFPIATWLPCRAPDMAPTPSWALPPAPNVWFATFWFHAPLLTCLWWFPPPYPGR